MTNNEIKMTKEGQNTKPKWGCGLFFSLWSFGDSFVILISSFVILKAGGPSRTHPVPTVHTP